MDCFQTFTSPSKEAVARLVPIGSHETWETWKQGSDTNHFIGYLINIVLQPSMPKLPLNLELEWAQTGIRAVRPLLDKISFACIPLH